MHVSMPSTVSESGMRVRAVIVGLLLASVLSRGVLATADASSDRGGRCRTAECVGSYVYWEHNTQLPGDVSSSVMPDQQIDPHLNW